MLSRAVEAVSCVARQKKTRDASIDARERLKNITRGNGVCIRVRDTCATRNLKKRIANARLDVRLRSTSRFIFAIEVR